MTWAKEITVNHLGDDERALLGGLAAGDALDDAGQEPADLFKGWRHVLSSLQRFGLAESKWEPGVGGARGGFVHRITDAGREVIGEIRLHEAHKPCCERVVSLYCVCRYKSRSLRWTSGERLSRESRLMGITWGDRDLDDYVEHRRDQEVPRGQDEPVIARIIEKIKEKGNLR